jgi:SHAQKYF class myb-like DNA-binding protein
MIATTAVAVPPSCDARTAPLIATTGATSQEEEIPHVIIHSDESIGGSSLSSATTGSSVHIGDDDQARPMTGEPEKGWSREEHRAFVENIYELGLRNASPSVLLENMKNESGFVTKERAKSHLQKYRVNKTRSKEDFLAEYDGWMNSTQETIGRREQKITTSDELDKVVDPTRLGSGEIAAYLSLACMVDDDVGDDLEVNVKTYSNNASGLLDLDRYVEVPDLTEDEKASPLGKMMLNIMGCFSMIQKRLDEQRQNQALGTEPDCNDFPEDYCDIEPVPLSPPRKRALSATWDYDSFMPMMLMSPPCAMQSEQDTQVMPPLHLTPAAAPPQQQQPTWRPPAIHGSHPIPYQRRTMLHHQQQQPGLIHNPHAAMPNKRARIDGPDTTSPPVVLTRLHTAHIHERAPLPPHHQRPGGCGGPPQSGAAPIHLPYRRHPALHHPYSSYPAGQWHSLPPPVPQRRNFVPSLLLPHRPAPPAGSTPLPGRFLHRLSHGLPPPPIPPPHFGYNSMGKAVHPK